MSSNDVTPWLALLLCAFAVGTARADSLTANFNSYRGKPYDYASWGSLNLALNPDGTIAANLAANWPVLGFGLDSATTLSESNFSAGTTVNTWGWNDATYGRFASGFSFCQPYPATPLSWTIGTPGEFTSVRDLLDGNGATVDFLLIMPIPGDGTASFGAMAPIPEPAPWTLALCGGVWLARRRRG